MISSKCISVRRVSFSLLPFQNFLNRFCLAHSTQYEPFIWLFIPRQRKNLCLRIMIWLLFLMHIHIHTVEMRYRTQLYSTLATSRSGTARNQFVMGWQWKVVDVCVFVSTTRLPRWRFIIWFLGNNPFRFNIVHWKRYFSIGWVCRETRKELTSAKVFGAHVKISFGENYTKTNHKLQYIRQICRHQLNSKLASWESWLSNGIGSVE